jgi:hypothetical protein
MKMNCRGPASLVERERRRSTTPVKNLAGAPLAACPTPHAGASTMQPATAGPNRSPDEDPSTPALTRHCLCGAVTITVAGTHDPRVGACHCRMRALDRRGVRPIWLR